VKAAHALRVGAVVMGKVERSGTQIVISAALIDGATGKLLWEKTFEPSQAGLMSVQDRIVLYIADGLRLRLSPEQAARLGGFGTTKPEAYELYLMGRFLLQSEEDDLEARRKFIKATEIDPNFVNAYLGISATYIRSIFEGYAPLSEALGPAEAAFARAAAIEPKNVAVRVARANLKLTATHDWAATEREYRAVLDEPALLHTTSYHPISLFFVAIGKPNEAVELLRRALAVDHGNLETWVMLGNSLLAAGLLDDALREYGDIIDDAPRDSRPWFGRAEVYKRKADYRRAAEARRNAYTLRGDEDSAQVFTGVTTESAYEKAEKTVAWTELRQLEEQIKTRYVPPFEIAHLYARIGDRKQALTWLERAVKDGGHVGLMLLKADRTWDWLRTDPRFDDVVRQLRIP
jgi:Tfp pilus assembly protein PilF